MNELTPSADGAQKLANEAIELAYTWGPKLAGALLVLLIGLWVINRIGKLNARLMEKKHMDVSLRPFLLSLINVLLKVVLFITVAGMVGIQTTSFIALIGAAGLAVGLALQGTLANFAGGVLILIFKPYKVGQLIEAQGHLGLVKEIQIFVTILTTPENKMVIIPNGAISNGNIINYTEQGMIRVDLIFNISAASEVKKAKQVLLAEMTAHPKVLKEPAPFVGVLNLNGPAVELAVRPYSTPEDYWDVYFDIYESGKEALAVAGVEGPQPSMLIKN
jgi:small conductance mechanosensitive channel